MAVVDSGLGQSAIARRDRTSIVKWRWDGRRSKAAALLAEKRLPDSDVCRLAGCSLRALVKWRNAPEFARRVDELAQAYEQAILTRGIALRTNRVAELDRAWRDLQTVREDRGSDPSMADVPGGTTGTLVRSVKQVGSGRDAQLVNEYTVDDGLLRELRETAKQAAIELGQWQEQLAITSDAPPAVLSQVIVTSREDARTLLARLDAGPTTLALPTADTLPLAAALSLPVTTADDIDMGSGI